MNGAAVSVVIPVHNRAHLVGAALGCALGQTLPPCDVIVVDDASTDDLEAVLHGLPQVRLIRLPAKSNAAHARNVGAEAAAGRYVAFLDSDDRWTPDHLESKVNALAGTPQARGAYGNFFTTYRGRTIGRSRLAPGTECLALAEQLLGDREGPRTSTFVFDRQSFLETRFDPDLAKHQDWDLILRFAERFPLAFDERPTALIETGDPSRMSNMPLHHATARFLRKHRDKLSVRRLARLHSKLALTTYLTEGRSAAFYEYYRSVPWRPVSDLRVLARKLIVCLPGSHRLIRAARTSLRVLRAAREALRRPPDALASNQPGEEPTGNRGLGGSPPGTPG